MFSCLNLRMTTLVDRLTEVMAEKGWEHADLVRVSRQSPSVVSQWLGKGSKVIKTIGKMEAAVALEQASGFCALWLATGSGPKRRAENVVAWPFQLVSRARFDGLGEREKGIVEDALLTALEKIEARQSKPRKFG